MPSADPSHRLETLIAAGVLALCASVAAAQPRDPQLAQVRAALADAERGQFNAAQYAGLSSHPLYGWIEYAALKRDIDTLPNAQAQAFLARHKGEPVAEAFRESWLAAAARREDWPAFRAAWSPTVTRTNLRCAELDARQATGQADARWTSDVQAIWRSSGKSLPDACDRPFAR